MEPGVDLLDDKYQNACRDVMLNVSIKCDHYSLGINIFYFLLILKKGILF